LVPAESEAVVPVVSSIFQWETRPVVMLALTEKVTEKIIKQAKIKKVKILKTQFIFGLTEVDKISLFDKIFIFIF